MELKPARRTNVRIFTHLAHSLVRTTAKGLQAVSADAATDLLVDRFLTPRRHRIPERERRWEADARRLDLDAGGDLGRLRVLVWGSAGPTVLLVHGWEGRATQLGSFVDPLVESGLRVVSFDQPGHGASSGTRSSLPWMSAATSRVAELFAPLHGILAHSLGAAATTVALAEGMAVRRAAYLAGAVHFDGFLERLAGMLGLDPALAPEARRRIEARFQRSWKDLEGARLAPRLEVPLLAFHDAADREIPISHSRRLVEAWPSARLLETHGLGHRRLLRDDGIVREVARYLAPRLGESARSPAAATQVA